MWHLLGVNFEKKSGSIETGKWSGILDEILPEIAVLTSGIDILPNILSIKVLLLLQPLFGERIWCCSELEAR